jgi:hypothetical protein
MKSTTPLYRNMLSYVGFIGAILAFTVGLILLIADVVLPDTNPYNALVTYLFMPLFIGLGLFLGLLGMFLEWRRRRKGKSSEEKLPVINFNESPTRRRMMWLFVSLAVFFSVSAIGMYRAFVFTESVGFCGTICHEIMDPEYTAYQYSPHARVGCVECHIGAGADWYVRSKLSGLRQVYRTILNTYELPIEVPIRDLRPARETCEECHWPEKFTGSTERVQWHFWRDEENTPSRYNIWMKVGGINRDTQTAHGIHWHISPWHTVRYWPRDYQRLEIPWVEVTGPDGQRTVYQGDDIPEGGPPAGEIRTMDCIDCHNRPSHIYRPPDEIVNQALVNGRLSRKLPYIKKNAVELLKSDFDTTEAAVAAIADGIREKYPLNDGAPYTAKEIGQAVTTLTEMYELTHFPEQKVSWKSFPNHIGHRTWPGCFRCHNEELADENGNNISAECSQCHDFVFQGQGEAAYGPFVYESQSYIHPGGMEDVWEGMLCTDCHGPDAEL